MPSASLLTHDGGSDGGDGDGVMLLAVCEQLMCSPIFIFIIVSLNANKNYGRANFIFEMHTRSYSRPISSLKYKMTKCN